MFKRLGNLIRGFFGLFVSGLEKKNPEALLEVEKENLRAQIAQYNKGLAAHAGLAERLMAQVRKLSEDETELRARAAAHLKAGNKEAAGQTALRLQTVRRELEENRRQLEEAETTYKELVEARDVTVRSIKGRIESLKRNINDLRVKQATAELQEMASGMITEIGGSGDTLSRLHEMVEEERQRAAGRARVARDSTDFTEIKMKAAEQDAMADLALADLAAELGMTVEGEPAAGPGGETEPAESEDDSRRMGPQSEPGASA